MTKEEHRERHRQLHKALDELVADWIACTKNYPSQSTILSLMEWSYQQTVNPVAQTVMGGPSEG